jgi:hypothetical protein
VEPAQHGNDLDSTVHLGRTRDGLVLGERLVRARVVAIGRVLADQTEQVALADHDDMVEQLST